MPPKSLMTRVLGAAIAVMSASAPSTAEISVEPSVSGAPARIVIDGPMSWDLADKFIQQADAVSNAIVVFNSEGGDLLAALIIGRTIHQKKFSSAVKDGGLCTTVCGLAWLAGAPRFLDPGARIGFRAASDSAGKASLEAYLNDIGLSAPAIAYINAAPTEGMNWLDHAQAAKLGLAISAAQGATGSVGGPSESLWDYDGSTLLLVADGMQRKLYYETPRPGLADIGVQRGTLFFVGQQKGRVYRGIARVFSKRCGAIPYSVSGEISEDSRTILVRGKAPSLDGKCRIQNTWDASATLVRSGQQSSSGGDRARSP
jgi:hypothetical protein